MKEVQVHGGYVLHLGNLEGNLKVGDKIICNIDEVRYKKLFRITKKKVPPQHLESGHRDCLFL